MSAVKCLSITKVLNGNWPNELGKMTNKSSTSNEDSDRYNRDIHISAAVISQYPRFECLLRNAELESLFDKHDAIARRCKKQLLLWGSIGLFLGITAIVCAVGELTSTASGRSVPKWFSMGIEILAVVALSIFAFLRLLRVQSTYLDSCMVRERLRHWKYQTFLDGNLVEKIVNNPGQVKDILAPTWLAIEQIVEDIPGARNDYCTRTPRSDRMMFKPTAYKDASIAEEVFGLMEYLRFNYQAQFTRTKLDDDPYDRPMSLREHLHWSEAFAKASLVGAFVLPVVHAVLEMMDLLSPGGHGAVLFPAGAISMAVVSAGVRAYQSGIGVPEEIESYEEYVSQVEALRAQFAGMKRNPNQAVILMRELELEAERELRRFLCIKRTASFLL